MIIIILLSFILILLIYNYYMHHGRRGRLINLIPGPPRHPISGSVFYYLKYYDTREKMWKTFVNVLNEYYPIFKFWAFFMPLISISHPDDLQIILNNTKHIEKAAKWHSRRKLLNPTFHFNILKEFVEIFIDEGENMVKSLKNEGDMVVKDLVPFFSKHTLNALCETVMGTSLQDFSLEFQQQYIEAIHRINAIILDRAIWKGLHLSWIYPLTSKGREQKKILKILHGFTEQVIAKRKFYHERTNGRYLENFNDDTSAVSDDILIESKGIRRKRLATLDLLIKASRDGFMTDLDVREEVDTIMFGGHDTTAISLCYTLALLAEHKNIQNRVRNEIDTALQENGKKFTSKLLQDLSYLERCIKESLRLYPSAFLITRLTGEDVKLQSYLVPAETIVHLNIYGIHRNPNFWENPEVFDPDRFLPENIRNRHPYSYIPFSAGPRNCIGQRFAMLEMKAMVASLVHNFYIEPIDDLKNLRIEPDVIFRPYGSLRVRFVRICKTNANL